MRRHHGNINRGGMSNAVKIAETQMCHNLCRVNYTYKFDYFLVLYNRSASAMAHYFHLFPISDIVSAIDSRIS